MVPQHAQQLVCAVELGSRAAELGFYPCTTLKAPWFCFDAPWMRVDADRIALSDLLCVL
jgi:hypothetical protein